MKNIIKWFGIIALAAVIVFSMTAATCGSKSDGSSGGGGSGGIGIGQTTFTLTDIPSKYEGKYARISLVGGSVMLTGAQNITSKEVTLPKISNGQVIIPLWVIKNITSFVRYTDNGNFTLGTVNIYNSGNDNVNAKQKELVDAVFMSVAFSKGNVTKSWKDALTVVEQ